MKQLRETWLPEYSFILQHLSIQYFIGGAIGGISVVFVGYPFDTIKVYLQTKPQFYRNSFHVVKHIIKTQGPYGLYQGSSAPLLVVVPLSALSFFSFALGKFFMDNRKVNADLQSLSSGVFSGACTTVISTPCERIKCLLQLQSEQVPKKYRGLNECVLQVWKDGGMRNLYAGTCATLLRDIPACATYFFSYERTMEFFMRSSTEVTWQPFIAGGIAGMISWAISMPADVMKTRIQVSPVGTYPRGIRSLFPIMLKEKGTTAFFAGFTPTMMRAFLANAACFYTFELWMQLVNTFVS